MRRAGVDKNVRGVIFWHSVSIDMDFRYDDVDEAELVDAIDRTEAFLENVSQTKKYKSKIITITPKPIHFFGIF